MPVIEIPIDNGFYLSDSLPISNQECVNWYPSTPQVAGALTAGNLFGSAGISQITTTGLVVDDVIQVNRGSHEKAGVPYFLIGKTLLKVVRTFDGDGLEVFTNEVLGTIPGTGRVSMADNGTQLMVLVPGGDAYIINEASGTPFVQITAPGFTANGAPQIVVFIDSFFVTSTDNKRFIRSAANDGNSWTATDVFSAESDPDDIVSLHVHKNKLFVGGSQTIEEFQNLGGLFQRTGFFIGKGISSKFTFVESDDTFMFIGGGVNESPAIWALAGNSVQKISTTAIDSLLQKFTQEEIESAFAYTFAQKGAYFVGFSFPTRTFEYNTITAKWNERKSRIVNTRGTTETIRWRVNSIVTAYNRVMCGDSQDGRIGSVETETFTEYGEPIIRVFATQPFSDMGRAFSVTQLEATMEFGVGDLNTIDPQIRMSYSNDGRSFNNELSRSIGKLGQYMRRAIWRRLGRFSRLVVFKFVMSDPVKPVFIKLEANVRGGQ